MVTVKAYGWEEAFLNAIGAIRKEEAASILAAQTLKAINLTLYFAQSILASMVTFAVYSERGRTFTLPQVGLWLVLPFPAPSPHSLGHTHVQIVFPPCGWRRCSLLYPCSKSYAWQWERSLPGP
jgi:hypothetical protein